MSEHQVFNAKIDATLLGFEDHGIFTVSIQLRCGSGVRSFGGYGCALPGLSGLLVRILKVVGVSRWEDLQGKLVRFTEGRTRVESIGNIIDDEWLLIDEVGNYLQRDMPGDPDPYAGRAVT